MKYRFVLNTLVTGDVELRFPDIDCARAVYSSEWRARDCAFMLFAQAVQGYFEQGKLIPVFSEDYSYPNAIQIPADYADIIKEHNREIERRLQAKQDDDVKGKNRVGKAQ